jgi:tetratricopeptide (TPR) repeat protein
MAAIRQLGAFLLLFWLQAAAALAHVGVDSRIEKVNAEISVNPHNARLYLKRGELHREKEHWTLSWEDYQQAQANSDSKEVRLETLFCMGRMKLEAGQPSEALGLLQQVTAQNPEYKMSRLNTARAFYALDQPLPAVGEMDSFIALLDTPAPDYFLERARMARTIEATGLDLAIDGLNRGISQLGPLVALIDLLVDLHMESKNTDLALDAIQALPAPVRNLPSWRARVGDIHRIAGDAEAAQTAYLAALNSIAAMPAGRRETEAMRKLRSELCVKLSSYSRT